MKPEDEGPPGLDFIPDVVEPSKQDESPEYPDLVKDIFRSCDLHLIGGSRGAGKTALEIWMERTILAGEPFLGHATWRPPWWGVIILDRGTDDRLAWWKAAGMEPLPYIAVTEDASVDQQKLKGMTSWGAVSYVKECVDRLKPPPGAALSIDVMNFILGDAHLSYRQGFGLGMELANFARRKKITLFGVVHGGKQKAGQQYIRLTDRIIASTGFLGTASTISYLTTREEAAMNSVANGYQQFAWDPHHHPPQVFELKRTEAGLFELVEEEAASEFLDIVPVSHDEILAQIPESGWVKSNELFKLFPGVVKQTFLNRLWSLRNTGVIEIVKEGRILRIRRKAQPVDLTIVPDPTSDPA